MPNSKSYDKYTKVITADFPRFTVHSSIPTGASLSIVFDHYRLHRDKVNGKRTPLNLFFMSGTGMTKSIWMYYIKRLFQYSESNANELSWQLVNCVALDLVNHGDSAMENDGLLGWEIDWRDGSHDLIQVVKFLRLGGANVAVGHSMGGFQVLYSSVVAPKMFKFVVAIEPVTHRKISASSEDMAGFQKLMWSLDKAIRSEFKDEQDFQTYFKQFSFYKNFNEEIFQDFLNSEKLINKDGTIAVKTSKQQQLLCYFGGIRTFPLGLDIIKQITTPVVHIVGGKGKWNSESDVKEANDAMGDNLDFVVVPEGEHLLNCERPDDVLDIIKAKLSGYITPRSDVDEYGFIEMDSVKGSRDQFKGIFDFNYEMIVKEYFTPRSSKL
ncbi:hypothetical protein WICPIJ_002793 [Wickerhamomyces pijperi]|uniref:AB hydrolase-1 domain-containing protein n=1 Tax=Wickerhamomyces pijperi TaxID=599730 RepID=A0A9P8TPB5_WICPI|nr:hypothetical protein WICPIJ_002793 [Wickerhamomyces pijperi]